MNSERKTQKEEMKVRYLLGELAEKERVEFEDACFADDQRFGELLAIEAELTDDYVRGDLGGRKRERYEKHLLSTIEGKDNVEFARMITACPAPAPQAATSVPHRRRFNWRLAFAWLDFRGRAFQVSLAALTLIIVAVGIWLIWSSRQTRPPQEQAVHEPAPAGVNAQPSTQTPAQSTPPDSQAATTPELPKPNDKKTAPATDSFAILSLLVVPGFDRSTGGANDLIIPSQTRRVRLQLALEDDIYQSYSAVLRSVEGKEIFARQGLRARSTGSGIAVTLELPAQAFSTGDFILTLSGQTSQGEVQDVHKYFLSISKKQSPSLTSPNPPQR